MTHESVWWMMWPHLAPLCSGPRYLHRHSSKLGHVVALTLPRCLSFSLSSSSCSSIDLMRLSLANITTHHYAIAPPPTHSHSKALGEESEQWQGVAFVTRKVVITDRTNVFNSLSHTYFKYFLLSADCTRLWRDTLKLVVLRWENMQTGCYSLL